MPWAHGTTATCTFQGFFLQFGSASYAYSLMLMIYYILVIRYNKSNAWIATWAEPIMHAIPIAFYGGTATVGIVWKVFNPSGFFCWVGVYPPDCLSNPQVPCQRGEAHFEFFGTWMEVVPFLAIICLLILALVTISCTVSCQYAASRQSMVGNNSRRQTRQVIVQCFLYGLAFVNCILWSTMLSILLFAQVEVDSLGKHYWITALATTFFPLQGVFNFIIFIRPRLLRMRRSTAPRHERLNWFRALQEAVWNPSSQDGLESSFSRRSSATRQSLHRRVLLLRSASSSRTALADQRTERCSSGTNTSTNSSSTSNNPPTRPSTLQNGQDPELALPGVTIQEDSISERSSETE